MANWRETIQNPVQSWLRETPQYLLNPIYLIRNYKLAFLRPDLIAGLDGCHRPAAAGDCLRHYRRSAARSGPLHSYHWHSCCRSLGLIDPPQHRPNQRSLFARPFRFGGSDVKSGHRSQPICGGR